MGWFDFFRKKEEAKATSQLKAEVITTESELQFVSLLYEKKPTIDRETILEYLRKSFEQVDSPEGEALVFFFPDYLVPFTDGPLPAQAVLLEVDHAVSDKLYTSSLQQTWHWPEAAQVVSRCSSRVDATDLMSRLLPYELRVEYFQKFLVSVIKASNPSALHFRGSDKLVEPNAFVDVVESEDPNLLHGIMNVRFFNISNGQEGKMLMDTLGLSTYGIPDFECLFAAYEPTEIATMLLGLANYVFESGDAVRSNTTVQGIGKNAIWKTQVANAKVAPERLVVEVIPN